MAGKRKTDTPKPQVERKTQQEAKKKAIDLAVSSIENQFGKEFMDFPSDGPG